MNRTLRSIIFWVFILFFVTAAPLSVLYTAGYRYNAKNGSIVRTGGISITSTPRNATVFFDEEPQEKRTPFVFKRILPGEYDVLLQREGYHDWSGEIDVRDSQTTELHEITLLEQADITQTFITTAADIAQNNNGSMAGYIVKEGGWQEVWLYETKSDSPKLVDRISDTSLELTLLWSQQDRRFLVKDTEQSFVKVYNTSGEEQFIDSLYTELFVDVFWSSINDEILYIQQEEELFAEINTNTEETREIEATNEELPALFETSSLTFIETDAATELRRISSSESQLIALLPKNAYTIFQRDGDIILLTSENNELFIIDIGSDQPILFQQNVTDFDWHSPSQALVYTNGFEVNIFQSQQNQTELITRQSAFIDHVEWNENGRLIFFATNEQITAVESYPIAKQRVKTDLGTMQQIIEFWIEQDGDTAYIYGIKEGATGFYSLPLTR